MSRPRDPDIAVRILAAARDLLGELGPTEVTIEAIADRAGVSRPTVYRRWASRSELIFEAQTNASVVQEFPDLGSARAELVAALVHLVATMQRSDRVVSGDQFREMIVSEPFARKVWEQRWIPDREVVHQIWRRGVERGDLSADIDGNEVINDLVAVCTFRVFLAHQEMGRSEIEDVVDRVLEGVGCGDPA
ncbi:MAG: TetR/AcrR family transcriptional regulator [Ilumatobacteraceae bacterium]